MELDDRMPLGTLYIERFMRPLLAGRQLESFLTGALKDEYKIRWIAENSYTHVNSFDKIVLASASSGRKLVWHQWKLVGSEDEIEIHNHRWDFVSYVIRGTVEDRDYVPCNAGKMRTLHYRYRSPEGARSYKLQYLGEAALSETRRYTHRAGDFYVQHRDTVHIALALAVDTDTLIVQDAATKPGSDIYALRQPSATTRELTKFTPGEVHARIRILLEILAQ
ncbi:MAG: hypothetical protein ACRDSL_14080 [Pseudonocardiaceae bacterium]